jgi:ABC-2 type transport system ATP-binding protein
MRIEINDLTKTIKGTFILRNINLNFTSGKIYGIVGKNGSGKTMLLRAISGLISPTTGQITIDGKILGRDIQFPSNMGILIEKPEFLWYLSGLDNLRLLADIKHIATVERISEYMQLFDLDPTSKKTVRKYSLGMKQKLGIIQAIMEDQQLLVLDEAFNALDEKSVTILRDLLMRYKTDDRLIIITSHNKEDINAICDHTLIIESGEIKN